MVRALKGLVIVMAGLIFVGLVAVVWAIFNLNKPADNRDVAKITEIAETSDASGKCACRMDGSLATR